MNKEPVVVNRASYQVEVLNPITKEWYVRRHGFETLEETREYVKDRHFGVGYEKFRISKYEVTTKTTFID